MAALPSNTDTTVAWAQVAKRAASGARPTIADAITRAADLLRWPTAEGRHHPPHRRPQLVDVARLLPRLAVTWAADAASSSCGPTLAVRSGSARFTTLLAQVHAKCNRAKRRSSSHGSHDEAVAVQSTDADPERPRSRPRSASITRAVLSSSPALIMAATPPKGAHVPASPGRTLDLMARAPVGESGVTPPRPVPLRAQNGAATRPSPLSRGVHSASNGSAVAAALPPTPPSSAISSSSSIASIGPSLDAKRLGVLVMRLSLLLRVYRVLPSVELGSLLEQHFRTKLPPRELRRVLTQASDIGSWAHVSSAVYQQKQQQDTTLDAGGGVGGGATSSGLASPASLGLLPPPDASATAAAEASARASAAGPREASAPTDDRPVRKGQELGCRCDYRTELLPVEPKQAMASLDDTAAAFGGSRKSKRFKAEQKRELVAGLLEELLVHIVAFLNACGGVILVGTCRHTPHGLYWLKCGADNLLVVAL